MPLTNQESGDFLSAEGIFEGLEAEIIGLPVFVSAAESGLKDENGNQKESVRITLLVDGAERLWTPGKFALNIDPNFSLTAQFGNTRFAHEADGDAWTLPIIGHFERKTWKSKTRGGTAWFFIEGPYKPSNKPQRPSAAAAGGKR